VHQRCHDMSFPAMTLRDSPVAPEQRSNASGILRRRRAKEKHRRRQDGVATPVVLRHGRREFLEDNDVRILFWAFFSAWDPWTS
jgi:hypothetical protein